MEWLSSSNDAFGGNDEFIPLNSKKRYFERQINRPNTEYKSPLIDYREKDEDEGWASKEFKDQVTSTVSFFSQKTLRKEDEIFYILSSADSPSSTKVENALRRLSATILAYLDPEHSRLLVSGSQETLMKLSDGEIPKYLHTSFHMLRPVKLIDSISKKLRDWKTDRKIVLIATYPNLENEKNQEYLNLIKEYLSRSGSIIYEHEMLKDAFVLVETDFNTIKNLIEKSTFVYKVYDPPKGIIEKFENKNKKRKAVKASSSIYKIPSIPSEQLPIVTVLDSGVNQISQLSNLLISRSSFIPPNLDDEVEDHGHGTPIAVLASMGEELIHPTSRLISHKIWSPSFKNKSYEGIMDGIEKFSSVSRIFISSVNFDEPLDDGLLNKLNHLIQEKNICYINSAGNIPPNECASFIIQNMSHDRYFQNYPILSPSDSTSVIAVGSITKKVISNQAISSVCTKNTISPFSRCMYRDRFLFDCKKPEVVEHGGNINKNKISNELDSCQVGVKSIDKNGNVVDSLIGTSFSAPLFARKIATITAKYGKKIKNNETLKAIAIVSTINSVNVCSGFGEPRTYTGCGHNHALYFVEGEIRLSERKGLKEGINFDEITFKVPGSVGRFDVCLVHSDNFKKTSTPALNTYLKITINKWNRDSPVEPKNKEMKNAKTNVKILQVSQRVSMKSIWTLKIRPHPTVDIIPSLQKDIIVRYGCAILLTRKPSKPSIYSISQEINMMKVD